MPKPPVTKPRTFPKLPRGHGTWKWNESRRQCELRFLLPGGKRSTVRGDTPHACLAKRAAAVAEATKEAELAAVLTNGDGTVGSMVERFVAYHAGDKAPSTRSMYDYNIRHLCTAPIWQMRARDVTRGDIKDTLLFLVDVRDIGKSYVHKIRTLLGQSFDYGMDHGWVLTNPARGVKMPGHVRPPKALSWLDNDGFAAMRRYLTSEPSTAHTALLTALLTGLRPGEVLALQWDVLDLDAGTLDVGRNLQRSRGGRVTAVVDELKNEHSERAVRLPGDLVMALRRHQGEQRVVRMAAKSWADGNLVFARDDGKPLRFETLLWWTKKACRSIGVAAVSPHKLRHTHASALLDRGVSPADVAKQLGHKDMRMVIETYGHSMRPHVDTTTLLAVDG